MFCYCVKNIHTREIKINVMYNSERNLNTITLKIGYNINYILIIFMLYRKKLNNFYQTVNCEIQNVKENIEFMQV